jgi:hypothetical protein
MMSAASSSQASVVSLKDISKIVFLGNSITYHGKLSEIGWEGSWGMAATKFSTDYAHLVCDSINQKNSLNVNCQAVNIATFEQNYSSFKFEYLSQILADADVVIVQLGDNVGAANPGQFSLAYRHLIMNINDYHPIVVICLSNWFQNSAVDMAKKDAITGLDVEFIDIGDIAKDAQNFARYEHPALHVGVGQHPGDKGMAAIAREIIKVLETGYRSP